MLKFNLLIITLLLLLLQAQSIFAQDQFSQGKDYQITAPNVATEPVVEVFFNYACPGCYSIEPFIADLKQEYPQLKIKPVPVELRPSWKIYVKAYYIAEKLAVLAKSHNKIFHQIHIEKQMFNNDNDMKKFFLSLGVSEKSYDEIAKSYWLKTQVRQSKRYAQSHRIGTTPTLLVNQRYKLNTQNLGTLQRVKEAIKQFSGINMEKESHQS